MKAVLARLKAILEKTKRGWAALILFAVLFAMPYGAAAAGLIDGVNAAAWITIFAAFFVASLKIAFGRKISGRFRIDRHGNDLSLLALAGCLTLYAVQAGKTEDVAPGARRVLGQIGFADLNPDPVVQNLVALSVFAVLALLIFIATAFGLSYIRRIDEEKRRSAPVTAFVCYLVGVLSASFYALSLAVK